MDQIATMPVSSIIYAIAYVCIPIIGWYASRYMLNHVKEGIIMFAAGTAVRGVVTGFAPWHLLEFVVGVIALLLLSKMYGEGV